MSVISGWFRNIALVGVGLILAVVVAQVLYPRSWMLPVARIGHQTYFWGDKQRVRQHIAGLNTHQLTVQTASKSYEATLKDIGFTYDTEATIGQAAAYPLAHRLIPFSIIGIGLKPHPLIPKEDAVAADLFARRLAQENEVAPVNAELIAQEGKLTPVPGKPGQRYDPEAIVQSLRASVRDGDARLEIKPATVPPQITTEAVTGLISSAQKQIDTGLIINVGGERLTPSRAVLASWFRLSYSDTDRKLAMSLDAGSVQNYLATVKKRFYIAPGTTVVRMIDDQEVSRSVGAAGRGIDEKTAGQQILAALNKGETEVQLSIAPIAPPVSYVRTYSGSEVGLQTLLNRLVASKGNYAIAVREIGGQGRMASAGGGKQFVTASTYKLFVAYSTLRRIESGGFSWSDRTYNTDLATCFDRMIINSDNACAETLGARIGWHTIAAEMRELGLTATSFLTPVRSTADDEALFLSKLAREQILTAASRDRLIDRMKRQRYRQGIPAGTGTVVADKVGFLGSYLHDAAIVYGPISTYVLVILTSGSSWAQIADTARQVHNQMSQ